MNRPMKNRKNEIAVLMALDVLHMCYIARDENGELWAYEHEPEMSCGVDPNGEQYIVRPLTWYGTDGDRGIKLETFEHFFDEVNRMDEQAASIETLLMNRIRENPKDTYQQIMDDIGAMFNRATQHQDRDIFDE